MALVTLEVLQHASDSLPITPLVTDSYTVTVLQHVRCDVLCGLLSTFE